MVTNIPFSGGVVAVAGSRSLPDGSCVVSSVVSGLLGAGCSLSVGCATGTDASAVSCALAAGAASRLQVFTAFGSGGSGACRWSSVPGVAASASAGAAVSWLAGVCAYTNWLLPARPSWLSLGCYHLAGFLWLVMLGT